DRGDGHCDGVSGLGSAGESEAECRHLCTEWRVCLLLGCLCTNINGSVLQGRPASCRSFGGSCGCCCAFQHVLRPTAGSVYPGNRRKPRRGCSRRHRGRIDHRIRFEGSDQMNHLETDWLKRWAMYSPNAIALVDDATGDNITYMQAFERSNRLARHLMDVEGVKPGDRVAVLSTNELDYVLLFFAVQKTGAVLVPMNFRLTPPEL